MTEHIGEVVGLLRDALERLTDRLIEVIGGGRPQVTPIPVAVPVPAPR